MIFSIKVYEYREELIVSKMKTLDWYEVDSNEISKYEIRELAFEQYDMETIESIDFIQKTLHQYHTDFHNWGLPFMHDLSFYFNLPNETTEFGFYKNEERKYIKLMFGYRKIKKVFAQLPNILRYHNENGYNSIDVNKESIFFESINNKFNSSDIEEGLVDISFTY